MNVEDFSFIGNTFTPTDLKNARSKQILASISAFHNTIKLVGVKLLGDGNRELIKLDFLPDIPNSPLIDIQKTEQIAIITFADNDTLPIVFALRPDFPLELAHTNLKTFERPVNLCIFEESFSSLKYKWSGSYFLFSIMQWLVLSARNELHKEDQTLDPFILGSKIVISGTEPTICYEKLSDIVYRDTTQFIRPPIHKINLKLPEIDNGVVNKEVDDLFSLITLFSKKNIDFLELLKPHIFNLEEFGHKNKVAQIYWEGILLVNVTIPIVRKPGQIEDSRIAFKLDCSLGHLLHLYGIVKTLYGDFKFQPKTNNENLKTIKVETLNPFEDLSILNARHYSNLLVSSANTKFTLIGLGALGSQFFMNNARSGFGFWQLIDHDILLPHNFIRHASVDIENHTAKNKAEVLSRQANVLLRDDHFSMAINNTAEQVQEEIIKNSEIIIDMSASIDVERYVSNVFTDIRKMSLFLNPMGNDLVMLYEDESKEFRLDLLEFQYYKELVNNDNLHEHLKFEDNSTVRFSRSCRDITSKIPQDYLAIFSGISTRAVRNKLEQKEASIGIWHIEANCSIRFDNFEIDKWTCIQKKDWSIFINDKVIGIISDFRLSKLPNETGGILIGGVDTYYKKIYITNVMTAPTDSIERPTLFIRGLEGVPEELYRVKEVTNHNLHYLGEWHSHPKNSNLSMSGYDKLQFAELLEEAKYNGQPALMLILGDDCQFELYIDNTIL